MSEAESVTDKKIGINLSNANTPGYKAFENYLLSETSKYNSGVTVTSRIKTDIQGEITETKNEFDYVIEGKGFFVVECNGERKYTKAGRFEKNKDGFLVAPNGCYLLDELYTDDNQKQKEAIADHKQIKLTTIPLADFASQIYTDADKIADDEDFFINFYQYQEDSLTRVIIDNLTESKVKLT